VEDNSWFVVILLVILVAALYFGFKGFGNKVPGGTTSTVSRETVAPTAQPEASAATGLNLVITTPQDGATVTTAEIEVVGKTAPLAEVAVNDKEVRADGEGNSSVQIELDEGENIISVTANDAEGNYAEKEISVSLNTESRLNSRVWLAEAVVTKIEDTALTVTKDNIIYTVLTDSKTVFKRRFGGKSSLAEISTNDKLNILGKWNNEEKTEIKAANIRDLSIQKRGRNDNVCRYFSGSPDQN